MKSNRGRTPKAVSVVEAKAELMWSDAAGHGLLSERENFADVEARLFGMGEVLREIGQERAASLAFFLASLAGHRAFGDLQGLKQLDMLS